MHNPGEENVLSTHLSTARGLRRQSDTFALCRTLNNGNARSQSPSPTDFGKRFVFCLSLPGAGIVVLSAAAHLSGLCNFI
jgi:hypothetical protein